MRLKIKYAFLFISVLAVSAVIKANAQSGSIKGKVKEQNGKSLEGVLVRAVSAKNKEEKREIKSDAKGDFEFAALPAGEYALSFEKQGYKTFNTRKIEVLPGETHRIRRSVELIKENEPFSLIRGATLYGAGFTLPGAQVIIERIDGKKFKQETISREGGEFAFRLRAEKAKYRITATARGFQSASTEIEIDSDEVRNIALTLHPER